MPPSEYPQLPGARYQIARSDWPRLSGRIVRGRYSHSDHLYDGSWRYSDVCPGDEGRCCGLSDQAVSPSRDGPWGEQGARGGSKETGGAEDNIRATGLVRVADLPRAGGVCPRDGRTREQADRRG